MKKIFAWWNKRRAEKEEHERLLHDWELVHKVKLSVKWDDISQTEDNWAYLYENGLGHRKKKIVAHGFSKSQKTYEQVPLYCSMILPWIDGEDFVEIQTYEQAKQAKMAVALKR